WRDNWGWLHRPFQRCDHGGRDYGLDLSSGLSSGLCVGLSVGLSIGPSNDSLRQSGTQDDYIHATVHAAAFCGEIGRDRMIFRVTGSAQAIGSETFPHDKEPHNLRCPGCREFPVRGKLRSVNGDVIGVAFDSQAIGTRPEQVGDAVEGGL